MIDRTLHLSWRKGVLMAGVWAAFLAAHLAVVSVWHVNEVVLFLAATFVVPLWAISAAVYTFDRFMGAPGQRWRHID